MYIKKWYRYTRSIYTIYNFSAKSYLNFFLLNWYKSFVNWLRWHRYYVKYKTMKKNYKIYDI